MSYQQILGAIAAGLLLYSFFPYLFGIFKRTVKPHAFTWLIWSLLSGITFAAQISGQAGAGAWITGVNTLSCLAIAILAFMYGTKNIKPSDWAALIFGLMAIPVWVMTHHPLWSVVIVCIIDVVAFWPTVRKSWNAPNDEAVQTYFCGGLGTLISIFALQHMSAANLLYPLCLTVINLGFCIMVLTRRLFVNK